MINLDGYIRNPWEKRAHDGLHVSTVLSRIEKIAAKSSGLHDVIFHKRCIDELLSVLKQLNPTDSDMLIKAAAGRGYELNDSAVSEVKKAYIDFLKELQQFQM